MLWQLNLTNNFNSMFHEQELQVRGAMKEFGLSWDFVQTGLSPFPPQPQPPSPKLGHKNSKKCVHFAF